MSKASLFESDHTVKESELCPSRSKNHRLFLYEETDSTNLRASELIRSGDAREGDVFIARRQSRGRGTKGRSFFSADGLYMSVILPRDIKIPLFTAFVSVCVVRAIKRVCGADCLIKWVNDIIIEGKKICGILCESLYIDGTDQPPYVIAGIGINTNTTAFPAELESIATSLRIQGYEVDDRALAEEIVRELDTPVCASEILSEYKSLSSILGKRVSVTLPDGTKKEGLASNIGFDGSLTLSEGGTETVILCADVFPL